MKECKRVGRARLGGVGVLLIAALAAGVSVGYAADPTNGQKIYNQQCANCHGSDGRGAMPGVPNFTLGMALMKSDTSLAEYHQRRPERHARLRGDPQRTGYLRRDRLYQDPALMLDRPLRLLLALTLCAFAWGAYAQDETGAGGAAADHARKGRLPDGGLRGR